MHKAPDLFSYKPHWARRLLPVPELPMSREEMERYGWDACDVILVTGDAYVDHPSFGMALIGRLLEAQGFRVGIIAQPDWRSAQPFAALGRPTLFFGVTAGNMDSMVNRYTADRKLRSDDAYSPDGAGGHRPDRSTLVYAQRCREAFPEVPVVIGGIEASLRRIAHYDYWSDKVRRSVLVDSKADLLLFGNAERAIVELAHRLARGEAIAQIRDLRGSAFMLGATPEGWSELDSSEVDAVGPLAAHPDPYQAEPECQTSTTATPPQTVKVVRNIRALTATERTQMVIRLPSYDQVRSDPVLYAHASRVFHLETNPGNARPLIQGHGERQVWLNPPPIPLKEREFDALFELPYTRRPHSRYGSARMPAYEMIRFSVNIMRGCFGGCTFCSITEHEGRIIQNRSEGSVLHEIETIRDQVPGFTGVISDLGGPTANMYRLHCKSTRIESACRRLSCVYPKVCDNLITSQKHLTKLYRKARALPGIKRIFVASGLRYDLAVLDPEYLRELVTHHVGGYLKIAPEHTEEGPLSLMMKPGIGTYDRFKALFDQFSKEAGKEQYLIPYFIAAHPGTRDEDMLNLALWLKRNGFRPDQVQTFLPAPLALATAMFHTGYNPLKSLHRDTSPMSVARGLRARRLHKAFLRYHDAENWPLLRETLKRMGRADLIGNGKRHLIPAWQPGVGTVEPLGARPQKPKTPSDKVTTAARVKPSRRDTTRAVPASPSTQATPRRSASTQPSSRPAKPKGRRNKR